MVTPSGCGGSFQRNVVPPQSSTSMPRWWRYQAARASGSLALRKTPPIPVTRFTDGPSCVPPGGGALLHPGGDALVRVVRRHEPLEVDLLGARQLVQEVRPAAAAAVAAADRLAGQGERGPAVAGIALGEGGHDAVEPPVGHDRRDQPHRLGRPAIDRLAGEDEVGGALPPD